MRLNIRCEQGLRRDTHIVYNVKHYVWTRLKNAILTLSMVLNIMCEQGLRSDTHIVYDLSVDLLVNFSYL